MYTIDHCCCILWAQRLYDKWNRS